MKRKMLFFPEQTIDYIRDFQSVARVKALRARKEFSEGTKLNLRMMQQGKVF